MPVYVGRRVLPKERLAIGRFDRRTAGPLGRCPVRQNRGLAQHAPWRVAGKRRQKGFVVR